VPALVLTSACAGKRIDNGVYHSSKGYRVTVPGDGWVPVADSRADLELRYGAGPAAIAANAVCDGRLSRRDVRLLSRHLLIGLRDRKVIETGELAVGARRGARTLLDARAADSETPVRIETIVLTDERCVYDLMYVAPRATFADTRGDFERFVQSFESE
jgi:hypothetical protein